MNVVGIFFFNYCWVGRWWSVMLVQDLPLDMKSFFRTTKYHLHSSVQCHKDEDILVLTCNQSRRFIQWLHNIILTTKTTFYCKFPFNKTRIDNLHDINKIMKHIFHDVIFFLKKIVFLNLHKIIVILRR